MDLAAIISELTKNGRSLKITRDGRFASGRPFGWNVVVKGGDLPADQVFALACDEGIALEVALDSLATAMRDRDARTA